MFASSWTSVLSTDLKKADLYRSELPKAVLPMLCPMYPL